MDYLFDLGPDGIVNLLTPSGIVHRFAYDDRGFFLSCTSSVHSDGLASQLWWKSEIEASFGAVAAIVALIQTALKSLTTFNRFRKRLRKLCRSRPNADYSLPPSTGSAKAEESGTQEQQRR